MGELIKRKKRECPPSYMNYYLSNQQFPAAGCSFLEVMVPLGAK